MGYTNDQVHTQQERDIINPKMRASPLWRNAVQAMGLDPDGPLTLSKLQQQQLAQAMGLPDKVHIDPAGNINDFHGWKGLPTAAKIAIVTGAAIGTAGAAGAFGGGAAAASAASAAPAVGAGGSAATTAAAVGGGMGLGGKILDIARGISPILGTAAKGRADTQQTNELLNIQRANTDLSQREYMRDSPGIRSRSAAKSSMIANYKPTSFSMGAPGFGERGETPSFSGGFSNPDMYSPEARQVANESIKAHLLASLNGTDRIPKIPAPDSSSVLDKILGAGAFGSSILGGLPPGVFGKRPVREDPANI